MLYQFFVALKYIQALITLPFVRVVRKTESFRTCWQCVV